MFTTSTVFLKTLADAGITHAFVNWGSDHPAMLEDIERQRLENGQALPRIVTCPNEMVALSCAQGYAQVTGRPAAVFIHVDVGTQALGGAVHNVDRCRTPVLIYAGAAPFTLNGELRGSRNEFIFWLQDCVDQPAIVRQYMRQTTQINSGKNVHQVVMRALQRAQSDPQGPVYLWARREIMEQALDPEEFAIPLQSSKWAPVERAPISSRVAALIASALATAERPLIVTSYLGRNPRTVPLLVELSERLAIPVYASCPTSVCFPMSHPHFVGLSYGMGVNKWLREADVILVMDSDIPWIPWHNKPRHGARIFHIDVDVLKQNMGMFHIDAEITAQADGELALNALLQEIDKARSLNDLETARQHNMASSHEQWLKELADAENPSKSPSITVPHVMSALRTGLPAKTLFLNEGISNYIPVWTHLRPTRPGSAYTSGASSLGWGLGAAIGASIGKAAIPGSNDNEFIALVVGDGSFLFGVPSSAYWIARRYDTPFLTVVLNNGGWKSPKLSMLGVHPAGAASKAKSPDLNVTFGPEAPDYSQIAAAAGGAWARRITRPDEVEGAIREATEAVLEERRCAVIDVVIEAL
ncbi:thiamine diphosphate-binding protein [Gautieria morchelliformis]|nr:thiamine diphosphate-binding protein [Gautieria morchelliformis]